MRSRGSILALLCALASARAQSSATRATLLTAPGGGALATVTRGAVTRTGTERGDLAEVTLDGWLATSMLGPRASGFDATVSVVEARLRRTPAPGGEVVAELSRGMGVRVVTRGAQWTRVQRVGWVARAALAATPEAAAPRSVVAQAMPAEARAADSAAARGMTATRATRLVASPDGRSVGSLGAGAAVTPLGRERGWVRVQVEGWVREADLVDADTSVRSPSAADLRADPEGSRGRIVRWTVRVLALRRGDATRRDLSVDEPYLLVEGPGEEGALSYLAIPPALYDEARAVPPMSSVVVTARVRTGRSDPTGVPVLELRTLARR